MAPKRGNTNRKGKRTIPEGEERIAVNLSISHGNGLRELFSEYLSSQGIPPTNDNIRQCAADWAYDYWEQRLRREIEVSDAAIII